VAEFVPPEAEPGLEVVVAVLVFVLEVVVAVLEVVVAVLVFESEVVVAVLVSLPLVELLV